MINTPDNIWQETQAIALADTLTCINNTEIMRNFLRDVMTEKEIREISARFKAAELLSRGEKYTNITKITKLSSRTIARINDWLRNGSTGYAAALEITKNHHAHILPARD